MFKNLRFALVLLVTMSLILVMFAGCGGSNTSNGTGQTTAAGQVTTAAEQTTGTTQEAGLTFPLKDQITIDFTLPEHPTQGKYQFADDGQPGFKWLEEQTNIKLNVNQIPQGDVKQKINLMISTNDLPDILLGTGLSLNEVEKAGNSGLFVNILDDKYKSLIPNYTKLIDETPYLQELAKGGKIYGFYQVDPNAAPFNMVISYRKDLWDKYNLNTETWDGLYEALKTLKTQYPKSYPFGTFSQGGTVTILSMGPSGFRSGSSVYYNYDKKQYFYGPTEDNYKLYLEYFAKLYKEKLLNPEYATMTYEQWSQSWINDETFIGYWWSATGNWFSPDSASNNPNYGRDKEWVEALRIPAMTDGGPRGWTAKSIVGASSAAPYNVYDPKLISTKSKYINEIMMLMDFLSVRDNVANLTYGPKGVEWDIVDGKYRFTAKDIKTLYNPDGTKSVADYYKGKYNLNMASENNFSVDNDSQISYDLNDAYSDPDYAQFLNECDMYVKDGSTQKDSPPIVRFSDVDSETATQLKTDLDTYANEISIKIINGQLPISEFDNMKKKLVEMGSDKLIDLFNKASGQ